VLASLIDAVLITVIDCVLMYAFWVIGMAAGILDSSSSHWLQIACTAPLFFLDALTVVAAPLVMFYFNATQAVPEQTANLANAFFLSVICVNWLYHAVFESSHSQGTPGKIFLELSVLRRNGGSVDFLGATMRHLLKLVSALTLFLPMFGKEKKQCVHDLISRATVFAEPADPKA